MTNKKNITISIDYDLWFYYRSKDSNLSQMTNDYLKMNRDLEITNNKEIEELETELKKIEEDEKNLRTNKTQLQLTIIRMKEEEREQEATELKNINEMDATLKAGGQLSQLIR